jgi:hypothetical protein
MSKRVVTEEEPARGCPDDCNIDHPLMVFARRNAIARSTIYRLKKQGMPVQQTRLGPRINCQKARDFIRCKPQASTAGQEAG